MHIFDARRPTLHAVAAAIVLFTYVFCSHDCRRLTNRAFGEWGS